MAATSDRDRRIAPSTNPCPPHPPCPEHESIPGRRESSLARADRRRVTGTSAAGGQAGALLE
jgi:hypothetical protein